MTDAEILELIRAVDRGELTKDQFSQRVSDAWDSGTQPKRLFVARVSRLIDAMPKVAKAAAVAGELLVSQLAMLIAGITIGFAVALLLVTGVFEQ